MKIHRLIVSLCIFSSTVVDPVLSQPLIPPIAPWSLIFGMTFDDANMNGPPFLP